RRIIMYGSIFVGGAFGIVLALLFRPDPDAATGAAPTAAGAPVAPAPSAPPPQPAPDPAPATVAQAPPPPAPPPPPAATPRAQATRPASAPAAAAGARRPSRPATPAAASASERAATRPGRDADPDAAAIAARAGDEPAAVQQRRDDIRRRYALGLQRLAGRQYAEARDLLGGVASEAPAFRAVTARLAEADTALRQQATEGFRAAARLEESADWGEALKAYERLKPSIAVLPALAEATERTRTKMHEAGSDALTRARQYDSRGRVPEAIAWYQRAVAWLAADHPGLEAAKTRLAQLVNRP
ncbi:MAG: hypothetical protein ABI880_09320, partial [Acidobacteriota bacterium]